MLNFASKMNLKRSDKYISPSNLIIYHTWKKMIKNKNKKKKKKIFIKLTKLSHQV